MRKILFSLLAVSLTAAVTVTAPVARAEGGTSVGHGIKCYWVPVVQADGSTVYTRVCRKGI
jgi:hypothetical protein